MLMDRSLSTALLSHVSSCDVPFTNTPVFGPQKIPPLRTCFWGKLQPFAGVWTLSVSLAPPTLREV